MHQLISGKGRKVQSFKCTNNYLLDNTGKLKEDCFFRKLTPSEKLSTGGDFRSNRLDILGNHDNLESK